MSDSLCACFAFVFSKEEEDGAPSKTETEGCFLAWPGRGSDNGQITIEMMTETKPQPLVRQVGGWRLKRKRQEHKQLRWLVQVGPL